MESKYAISEAIAYESAESDSDSYNDDSSECHCQVETEEEDNMPDCPACPICGTPHPLSFVITQPLYPVVIPADDDSAGEEDPLDSEVDLDEPYYMVDVDPANTLEQRKFDTFVYPSSENWN
jgi:hypothetical protein